MQGKEERRHDGELDGTGAAPFPAEWQVEPNRADRLDDIIPDMPAKQRAKDAGKPFIYAPPLRDQILSEIPAEEPKK